MKVDVLNQPDSTVAHITFDRNEQIVAEAGAMIAMSGHLEANTTLLQGKGGGLWGGLKRVLALESLFLSTFNTTSQPGEIYLAPKLPGDIAACELTPAGLVVQSSSYLASTPFVNIDVGVRGLKNLFAGESLFWLNVTGSGVVLLSSFGAIYEMEVNGEHTVDSGHIVAFEPSLNFTIGKVNSSWLGAFAGGEGFVCHFEGQGRLYCQTHNPGVFGRTIGSQLPPR
ncbi:TIGR00266 family protein [Synechococcus sp. PCC 7336]|uniref:TIGR00266 family protein n=1 Tax=Synechococcus sp. PCC 7336 TaxID=195250 RepID=UPI0003496E14|nr:TIGR00266 family protein [Synechococcus sp. PCC 7336]